MTSHFFLFTKQDFYILDWTDDEDTHQTKYVKILQSGTQGALYFKTPQALPTVKGEKNPGLKQNKHLFVTEHMIFIRCVGYDFC